MAERVRFEPSIRSAHYGMDTHLSGDPKKLLISRVARPDRGPVLARCPGVRRSARARLADHRPPNALQAPPSYLKETLTLVR